MYRDLDEEIKKMEYLSKQYRDRINFCYKTGIDTEDDKLDLEFMKTVKEDISSMINDSFNPSIGKGFIKAYIPNDNKIYSNNIIYVSHKLLDNLKNNLELYKDEINDFWEEIADYEDGKKIGFIGECKRGCLIWDGQSCSDYEASSISSLFQNEFSSFSSFDAHVIFLAMLDLNKTYKYFTKASLETLRFNFVKEDGIAINVGLFGLSEYFSFNNLYNELPKGFKVYFNKQEIVNLNLPIPENKMAMIVWEKKINSIKITQKFWEQINLSVSCAYRKEQWLVLEEKFKGKKWFDKKHINDWYKV